VWYRIFLLPAKKRERNKVMIVNLEGIVAPVLTPFTADADELDVPALEKLVNWLIGTGVSALIANAGTSEFYHLDESERIREAEIVVELASGKLPVLVGAGAIGTRNAVRWARHAEKIGADGLLVMPPYYEPPTKGAILKHYAAISDAVSIPIMLYNTVFVSQVHLSPTDIALLSKKANIPWVKLTTGVVEDIPIILDLVGDKITIFEGMDTLAFPSLAMGAAGCVLGAANAVPELLVDMWRFLRIDHNLSAAYEIYRELAPFFRFICDEGVYCSALKEICRLRGIPLGAVRLPWEELNVKQRTQIRQFAIDLKVLDEPNK
jgi:4-hydroxy-tetrahydrodipicolinate synthase